MNETTNIPEPSHPDDRGQRLKQRFKFRRVNEITGTFVLVVVAVLIAAMVWMIPSAESAKFSVITLMTYLIAIGGFTHIVAGSMEAYMLVLAGDWEWWRMISQFVAPVLLGNIAGGTALFALISYAQVMEEI